MSTIAAQRTSVVAILVAGLVLTGFAAIAAWTADPGNVLTFWAAVGGACAFVWYAVKGDLLAAVLAWFAALMCLHDEFWRDRDAFFFAITIPRLMILALVALLAAMLALRRLRWRPAWPIGGVLLALVAYFAISAAVSGFQTRSIVSVHYRLIGGYVFAFLAFVLMLHATRGERDLRRIAWFFAAVGAYLTYVGWCEQFKLFGLVWPSFIGDPSVGIHWGRVRGPFVMSAAMGLTLVYCFFNNLVLARHAGPAMRWALAALNALMLPAIFWTKTRSVWLAFVICGIVWILYSRRRVGRIVSVAFLSAVAIAVTVVNLENFLGEERARGGLTDVEPILVRIGLMQTTGRMVVDHPIIGVGFGHFRDHAPRYAGDPSSPYYAFSSTAMEHNNLLSIAAETGLLGLGLYVVVLVLLLRRSASLFRKLPDSAPGFVNRDLIVLYWILFAAYFIDGTFRETSDNPFANSLFFGLSAAMVALDVLLSPAPIRTRLGASPPGRFGPQTYQFGPAPWPIKPHAATRTIRPPSSGRAGAPGPSGRNGLGAAGARG